MKKITNLLLVLALTTTMALADDGHTGTGNRCDTCPPPCTEACGAPEQESGTLKTETGEAETADVSIYEYWREVLIEFFY